MLHGLLNNFLLIISFYDWILIMNFVVFSFERMEMVDKNNIVKIKLNLDIEKLWEKNR